MQFRTDTLIQSTVNAEIGVYVGLRQHTLNRYSSTNDNGHIPRITRSDMCISSMQPARDNGYLFQEIFTIVLPGIYHHCTITGAAVI